ncbi:hypothetical protein SDC9_180629 [bioreactor metagenome]|uniref:Uncharacterized protein n=1 Tax=bioreactor metagenome TaxID=1076179 RepID=A0A645H3T4_9ZZZZ
MCCSGPEVLQLRAQRGVNNRGGIGFLPGGSGAGSGCRLRPGFAGNVGNLLSQISETKTDDGHVPIGIPFLKPLKERLSLNILLQGRLWLGRRKAVSLPNQRVNLNVLIIRAGSQEHSGGQEER